MITQNQIKKAKLRFLIGQDDDCVGRILSKKKDEGKEIDDQAIAIALSECGQSKEQKKGSKKLKIGIAKLKLKQLRIAAEGDPSSSQQPGSPDGPHFTLKKIKRKGFPEGRGVMEKVGIMRLASDENKYAKYYLLDGLDINGNGWGVTNDSIPKNIETFIGQPFVITARDWIANSPYEDQYDHPFVPSNDLNSIFAHQERFRVGDIVKVAKDDDGRWYAMIKKAKQFENMSFPPFCSPAIYQINPHEPDNGLTEWFGLHLAGLMDEPAYGPRVALLKGSCSGTMGQCSHQFRMAKQRDAVGLESSEIKPIQPIGSSGIQTSEFSDSGFGDKGDKEDKEEKCECPKLNDMKARMKKIKKAQNKKLGSKSLKAQVKKLKKKPSSQYGRQHTEEEEPKEITARETPKPLIIQLQEPQPQKSARQDTGKNMDFVEEIYREKIAERQVNKKIKSKILETLEAINGDK